MGNSACDWSSFNCLWLYVRIRTNSPCLRIGYSSGYGQIAYVAPQAICPDIFLAGVTVRLKLTTRRLNMRILRRLACTAVHIERTYKNGSVSNFKVKDEGDAITSKGTKQGIITLSELFI